jgi:hypothetical protein
MGIFLKSTPGDLGEHLVEGQVVADRVLPVASVLALEVGVAVGHSGVDLGLRPIR